MSKSTDSVSSTSPADAPEQVCPECGGEICWSMTTVTGIQTFIQVCLDCEWRGEPE